jgi:CubicO group peptidase (beta-lactamase class C family)
MKMTYRPWLGPLGLRDTTLGLAADRAAGRESAMNRGMPVVGQQTATDDDDDDVAAAKLRAVRAHKKGFAEQFQSKPGADASRGYGRYGHNSDWWRTLGAPWAGLLTTAADLARLFQALVLGGALPGGAHVLRAETLAAMTRCQTHGAGASVPLPRALQDSGVVFGGAPASHWGLSLRLNSAADKKFGLATGPAVFGHHGGAGAMAWADPVTGASFVVLTNEPTMVYSDEFNELSDLAHAAVVGLLSADGQPEPETTAPEFGGAGKAVKQVVFSPKSR